jgi:hypothetical protein
MKLVRIITPENGIGWGTKIFTADGQEIPGVTHVQISIETNLMTTAEISVAVGDCDIHAHPLLSLESLRDAAALHGFILTPMDSDQA